MKNTFSDNGLGGSALMTSHNVDNIPAAMKALRQWVVWRQDDKRKVPYSAESRKMIDITNPREWAHFECALGVLQKPGFSGVGFALDGSGISAVDLDDCIDDGKINPAALALLERLEAGYVEISPSGRGLHAFGFAPPLVRGRRTNVDGISIEFYSRDRFLTVTGIVPPEFRGRQFGDFSPEFVVISQATRARPTPDGGRAVLDAPAPVGMPARLSEFPAKCLPSRAGERHIAIFELARHLKATCPNATESELTATLKRWHALVLPIVGTKDFEASRLDFVMAWLNVKFVNVLEPIVNGDLPELKNWMVGHHFGVIGTRLLRICMALEEHFSPEPFFLASRAIAPYFDKHHTWIALILKSMCSCGLLQIVELGTQGHATRYRLGSEYRSPFSSTVKS